MLTDEQLEGLAVRFVEALERLASALDRDVTLKTAALEEAARPQPPAPCTHPPEARIDFGVTNGREDFQCRRCGYRPPTEG